jgi:SAM-dependent methyltransferase
MPALVPRRQSEVAVAAWFAGPAGAALLASEAGAIPERAPGPTLWLAPLPLAAGRDRVVLHAADCGFAGAVRAGLPLPLASGRFGRVVVQHLGDLACEPLQLLEDCARVLADGGQLWLLALNPLSPYRLRWQGQGPRAAEPFAWRRRLRAVGLQPGAVTRGLGPVWSALPDPAAQDGAGLRAAFLLRAEKRRLPLTLRPARTQVTWQAEPTA